MELLDQSYPALTVPLAVPAANSANNVTAPDVIGSKTDTEVGNSIYSMLYRLGVDNHAPMAVYPTLAAGSPILSSAANWTYGALTELMPAATVAFAYRLLYVELEACNKDGVFQLELCQGAADTVIMTLRYAITGGFTGSRLLQLPPTILIPANARIRARLASSDGLANQCTQRLSLAYR